MPKAPSNCRSQSCDPRVFFSGATAIRGRRVGPVALALTGFWGALPLDFLPEPGLSWPGSAARPGTQGPHGFRRGRERGELRAGGLAASSPAHREEALEVLRLTVWNTRRSTTQRSITRLSLPRRVYTALRRHTIVKSPLLESFRSTFVSLGPCLVAELSLPCFSDTRAPLTAVHPGRPRSACGTTILPVHRSVRRSVLAATPGRGSLRW
jgi:hypothetical protein